MQGDTTLSPIYMDNTEVYILDGAVRGVKAIVEQILVYRFDIPTDVPYPVVEALQPDNTTFFFLASDGVARSQDVMNNILGMFDKLRNAIIFLQSETDNQSDDFLTIGDTTSLRDSSHIFSGATITTQNLEMAKALLTIAPNLLLKDLTIDLYRPNYNYPTDGYLTNSYSTNSYVVNNHYILVVNISNLYRNPPVNPKKVWLPAYTVTVDTLSPYGFRIQWVAETYEAFTFPDPSFSGLFISITNETLGVTDKNENLKTLLGIERFYRRLKIVEQ